MLTFPATISNNFDKVSEFINTYTELTGEIDELDINLKFELYTPVNPYKKFLLELSHESFHYSKFNSSLETKFIIHGFREILTKESIIYVSTFSFILVIYYFYRDRLFRNKNK